MPAIYAHHVFGREVTPLLPKSLQSLIKKYPDHFEVGLQGPDILFFYRFYRKNPISQIGYGLHRVEVAGFLERGRRVLWEKGLLSAECAYLIGFLCHFMLDSACHPYVNEQMEKHGIGHIALESEFEKYLLMQDGEEPLSYPMGRLVPAGKKLGAAIAPFYEGVTGAVIDRALDYMKFCKTILVAPGKGKRALIEGVLKLAGGYERMGPHLFQPGMDERCAESNPGLWERLCKEAPAAAEMAEAFYGLLPGTEKLPERFFRDFN